MVVTKSAGVPGSANNDINPMLGYVTPIVSPQLTSPSQWFLVGDPREIDTIELGFVGGQADPSLFIQDQPIWDLILLRMRSRTKFVTNTVVLSSIIVASIAASSCPQRWVQAREYEFERESGR